jgi:aminopeptidase N
MTTRASSLILAALLFASADALAQRLPPGVSPEHYDLAFTIDFAHARFDGTTGIDVRIAQTTTTIRLHALELDIKKATVSAGGQSQTARVTTNPEDQTATLTVARSLPAGPARIEIAYAAALNDKLRGLYLSKGPKRTYAVTQLESTDARRAFPCFDEPSYKATFTVTVTADRGDVAISNGRMASDTPGPAGAQHTMKFSPTPKMSTYLVAIAVGDFQCLEGSSEGVPIRICATPDKKDLGRIALESAERVLSYLNGYHTIKYPFGKLDVVAVPDFAAGAMENVAAIFYRETDLLADSATASLAARKTIMSILSHEMAHQWFGDLVTMQWWDDVWLNEGFATWMATRPSRAQHPEWHTEVSEALETQTAINLDSLDATHPIHVNVNTPDEIESVFDPISYEKGGSVLRMVESYIGDDTFRRGVNGYLEKHQYANATSEDFLSAVSGASGKPVDRVMGTFVLQPGVPQLTVTQSCSGGHATATLTQSRFALSRPGAGKAGERWQIPVCVKTSSSAEPQCTVMSEQTQTIPLGASCPDWIFVNAGGRGYYRTEYTADTIKALARGVETTLTAPERVSLVSDEWALVRAARHSVANYLDLASGFGREPIAEVLGTVTSRLGFIDDYLTSSATRPPFRTFVRSLLEPAYRDLGFERRPNDSEDVRSLRRVVVGALGLVAEDEAVVAPARDAVRNALSGGAPLDPIAADTLVSIAASHGDAQLFDDFLRAADKATDPQEHYRYLYALTNFQDPALIRRALDYALSPGLKSQDASLYLSSFFGNDTARDTAWRFVKERWSELEPKITISLGDIGLVSSLSSFCSADARDDIRGFFTAHKLPTAGRALRQTIERIDNCIAIREQQAPALKAWLARTER